MKSNPKILRISLLIACAVAAILIGFFVKNSSSSYSFESSATSTASSNLALSNPQSKIEKDIKMIFVGDIMLSRHIGNLMVKMGDWRYPFFEIGDYIRNADLTFANLEGPISDRGTKIGSIYSFRADPRSVAGLVYSGIDVVSVANNHIWDYGPEAFSDTLKILSDNGISYIGGGHSFDEAHSPVIKEINGTKIAFLGYTNLLPRALASKDAKSAVAFPDRDQMIADIAKAKGMADIVIVSFHWGDEYKTHSNSFQEGLGHAAIDAGANFVVGHHPHVAEEIEEYNGGYIAYSLGNFVFDQNFSEETKTGLLLNVTIRDKKIVEVLPQKVKFNESFQPELE